MRGREASYFLGTLGTYHPTQCQSRDPKADAVCSLHLFRLKVYNTTAIKHQLGKVCNGSVGKALAAELDNLDLVSSTHLVEGNNQLHKVVL